MTLRETQQVSVILLFIAGGFAFHFAFNHGLQTESSTPAAAAAPAISKKLERARTLQKTAIRLNNQRFVALKEKKAQHGRVARARARAARAFAAAGASAPRRTGATRAPRVSSPSPAPARSAPARPSPSPKPASSGGGGGGSFDDSG